MKRFVPFAVLVLVLTAVAHAQQPQLSPAPRGFDAFRKDIERGKVETQEYDSKTTGEKRKLVVYLPPGYSKDKKYPVLYLLHGKGGNQTNWSSAKGGKANVILDNLYADKKVVPMIVVMPNGTVTGPGQPKGLVGGFENELLKDIIPFVESRYPVQADAEHRALAGLSMGGTQSYTIGLKHPDKFAWVGGFAAPVFAKGKGLPYVKDVEAVKKLRLLWVSCGDKDSLMNGNKAFHAALEERKVPHVWHVGSGAHTFAVWRSDLYLIAPMLFQEKK